MKFRYDRYSYCVLNFSNFVGFSNVGWLPLDSVGTSSWRGFESHIMQNQVFAMRTADSMVMEWNVYMHVIDFSFTMQEVRYGSLLAAIAQNTTAAALDSPHFSKKGIMDFIHCTILTLGFCVLCEFLAC